MNEVRASLLNFSRAFRLWTTSFCFPKKEKYLVTFSSSMVKIHIDFLLLRTEDKALYKDCKVNPSENLLKIKKMGKNKDGDDRPRIKWGSLTIASTVEIE